MAQSRLSGTGDQGIGTRPGDLGAWNKLQLGWLDYETVEAGQKRTLELGPQEYNTRQGPGRGRGAAEEGGHHRPRRAVRGREASTSPATATTSTTR